MADYSDLMKLEKIVKQPSPTVPVQSPLPQGQTTQQEIAGKPANLQADKQVNQQTSKTASPQTSLHANLQASKPASLQPLSTAQPSLEKFSSYMRGDYKKRLKQLALDKDCDTYEVLQEAIELYFHTLDLQK